MNEFIKIGDVANLFSTLKSTNASGTATPTIGKKSANGLAIIAGILVVGIVGYELYLYLERERIKRKFK